MKHLKKNIVSNISSNNNIVSKNSKNYADFGQKNKPTGLTGKKNRLFKSLGIGAMAVFMGILTVLGTACTPTQTNTNPENGSLASGNNMEAVKPAPSPLGLDPKNDPIIYTTESGLEIKYGGISFNQSYAGSGLGGLVGYPYITMGTYNNKSVNWIIIGRANNLSALDTSINTYIFSNWQSNQTILHYAKYFFENIYETTSPAGNAINNSIAQAAFADYATINLSKPTPDSEIDDDCVLALCETTLGTSSTSNNYNNGSLKTACDNLYKTNLNLSDEDKSFITSQSLKNYYYGGGYSTCTQYIFPMAAEAGYGEFALTTYFNISIGADNSFLASSVQWWTRTGATTGNSTGSRAVKTTGWIDGNNSSRYATETNYIRPAMVVNLT
ncbi:MAG: hypothetical protein IJF22_00255 [Clostridia bacterium]|nr:hypothetical protein [Clostridia bacterium]